MSTNIGPHGIDLTAPGGIAALLDFHRRTFGDARMEDAAAAAAGAATATPAASTAAAAAAAATAAAGKVAGDQGFPANTPVAEMTPDERIAYDRHQREQNRQRRAEWDDATGGRSAAEVKAAMAELETLRRERLTPSEQAIEDAKREVRESVRAEARRELLPALVHAEFRAAAGARLSKEQIEVILAPLDPTKFLTADGGQVDTAKVQQFVDGIAPAGKQWPDMGQGKRGTSQTPAGVSAGRALHEERHAAKK